MHKHWCMSLNTHTHTLSLPYHTDKHATFTIYGAPFNKKIKASKS